WQDVLEPLLLDCPEPTTVIPLLVNELGNAQQRVPAGHVLLKFLFKYGPSYLPWMLPGLENMDARAYTKRLIVYMVDTYRQHNVDLLSVIVSLFEPAATRPKARIALRELLTQELAYVSRDALIDGLVKQQLTEDCILSLVMLVDLLD